MLKFTLKKINNKHTEKFLKFTKASQNYVPNVYGTQKFYLEFRTRTKSLAKSETELPEHLFSLLMLRLTASIGHAGHSITVSDLLGTWLS